jgi:prepilin-type N-terminal cleavage/methylation domain-containing protein
MDKQLRGNAGFTLLELLVVVAIIGLISSIAFVSMQHARAEARDVKRLADVDAIRTALELYYDDYGIYPDYHICNNLPAITACNSNFMPNSWIASLVPKYLKTLPADPLNKVDNSGAGQHYIYIYTRWEPTDNTASQRYYLVYRLETKDKINECTVPYGGNWSSICGGDL